jgi:CBS domain-containing protein
VPILVLKEKDLVRAKDIMSKPVVTVAPDTPVTEIAALLLKSRISGVPVLDQGRLVGLVSEGDLLRRHEIGTDRANRGGPWWLRMFSAHQTPGEYVKAHGRFAREVMTREVATITPDTPVAEIAALLESRRIKRVPVMQDTQLVGIVSRANLVQALAAIRPAAMRVTPPADQAIRGRLQAELERQPWWREATANIIVTDGVVHFYGVVHSDDQQAAARVAAENIPGVRGVEDHRLPFSQIGGW